MQFLNSLLFSCINSITLLQYVSAIIRYSTSSRRANMDNKISYKRLLWKHKTEGLGPCVGECASDEYCASVFFNRLTNQCQAHSITHGHSDGAENRDHWRYYIQPFGNNYIGDKCSTNTDCVTKGSECRNYTCECQYGHSFSPRTRQCLEDCTSYGQEFQEVPNFFISYNNLENIENVTVEECLEFCRNRTEYTCRSLEYGWVSYNCNLQNVTSLNVPLDWFEDILRKFNISHFLRDCA